MTTYTCWFEGYRNNENPNEVEADEPSEAAEKFSDAAFWDMDGKERTDWLQQARTVWVQGRGDDTAKAFSMSCDASVDWGADEI